MKCTHCGTNVVNIPINWKCPHCGEQLPELGFWARFSDGLSEYLQEKGAIFWGIIFAIILIFIGIPEMVFGNGYLLKYIMGNFLFAAIMIFYGGMIITMYMKIVLPLHLPFGGGNFIIRERATIRNYRKGTHIAAIAGILTSIFWLGPWMFLAYFPSYILVISVFLGMAWSIGGLFFDPKQIEDVRFRGYLELLGVTSLKVLRKTCVLIVSALFLAIVGYWILSQIPGLWQKIGNWGIVGVFVHFFTTYMGWLL